MEVYLVGGAVRDELLGREVKERDWVVVGGSAAALKKMGYRQVGRDFPVFLHPETQEEYALARTERKTAPGHGGFATEAGPDISLEADLARRDLSINAMAKDAQGRLIDPFGGQEDLRRRRLRHVADAFAEDPLRVFRVARFAAVLEGFAVHPETQAFMASMAESLGELAAERVWQEFSKALAAPAPQRFIEVLLDCGCLSPWFPELETAAIDPALDGALPRYGALGWSLSPSAVQSLSKRLLTPKAHLRLALDIAGQGRALSAWPSLEAAELHRALRAINGYRDRQRRQEVFAVVQAKSAAPMRELDAALTHLEPALAAIRGDLPQLSGAKLGRRLQAERIKLLAQLQRRQVAAPNQVRSKANVL